MWLLGERYALRVGGRLERAEGVFEAKSNSSGVRLTLKNPDNLRLQGNAGELSLKFFQRKVLD